MSLLGTIGGAAGSFFGGPIGGLVGSAIGNQVANWATPMHQVDPRAFNQNYRYVDPSQAHFQVSPSMMAANAAMGNLTSRQAMNNQLQYQQAQLGTLAAVESARNEAAARKAALDAQLATQLGAAQGVANTFANSAMAGNNLLNNSYVAQ
jgi:hypothetical protein